MSLVVFNFVAKSVYFGERTEIEHHRKTIFFRQSYRQKASQSYLFSSFDTTLLGSYLLCVIAVACIAHVTAWNEINR